jgi:hypothetical protein
MTMIEQVATALRRGRYRRGTEAILQQDIADLLTNLVGISGFKKEAKIGERERIDFLVSGGIGIEAKLKWPARKIYRQLERYAECPDITGLILISGTAMGCPDSLNGKPVYFVSLGLTAI